MSLKVNEYATAEKTASKLLPNRVIEAGGVAHFSQVGYPFCVTSDEDVWRFADAMHELGEASTFANEIQGLTEEEFNLIKKITLAVHEMCKKNYKQDVLPRGSLTRAILPFRLIRAILPPNSVVLEIGAGSGYLGALLALSGHTYIGVENAQGFYLYQNALWRKLFGSEFQELATGDTPLDKLTDVSAGSIIHAPWWQFYGADPKKISLNVDLATCNHVFCEMNRSALGFTAAISRDLLSGKSEPRYLVCEGPGANSQRTRGEMQALLSFTGHEHVFSKGIIDIFSPRTYGVDLWVPEQIKNDDENLAVASEPEPLRVAKIAFDLLKKPDGLKNLTRKTRSYLFGTPMSELEEVDATGDAEGLPRKEVDEISLPESRVAKMLENAQLEMKEKKTVQFSDLEEFRANLVGENGFISDDEKFLKYTYASPDW